MPDIYDGCCELSQKYTGINFETSIESAGPDSKIVEIHINSNGNRYNIPPEEIAEALGLNMAGLTFYHDNGGNHASTHFVHTTVTDFEAEKLISAIKSSDTPLLKEEVKYTFVPKRQNP